MNGFRHQPARLDLGCHSACDDPLLDDDRALLWDAPPPPPRQPKPGELLFEFVRASDRAPMSCELRFNGESYGWGSPVL